MYIDEAVVAGILALLSSLGVGGYVLYYMLHDIKVKTGGKVKAH
ncbi:MAG TPA: hypothetical protein VM553_08510 [Dongiaceae bacterium]|nr:hypothetical protein [Dongiaceae bacterium]